MHYITNCMLVFLGCAGLWVALACAVGGILLLSPQSLCEALAGKDRRAGFLEDPDEVQDDKMYKL